MTPYAETDVFTERELDLYHRAAGLVARLPSYAPNHGVIRCHELARALGEKLRLPVFDGKVGIVDHSWLYTRAPTERELTLLGPGGDGWTHDDRPRILDPYVPGEVPQVQLIDTWSYLSAWRHYRIGGNRTDIHDDIMAWIRDVWREY